MVAVGIGSQLMRFLLAAVTKRSDLTFQMRGAG
jgi:hypothetical protein